MMVVTFRTWRARMRWTQKQAAVALGVHIHTVKSWEAGRQEITLPTELLMWALEGGSAWDLWVGRHCLQREEA